MAFMPTRYLRTERDDVQQFFIDLDAKPEHDGEWRKVGQWNKDGSLSLYQQGEALTDAQWGNLLDSIDDLATQEGNGPLSENGLHRIKQSIMFYLATPKAAPAAVSEDAILKLATEHFRSLASDKAEIFVEFAQDLLALSAQPAVAPSDSAKPDDEYQRGFADGAGVYRANAAKAIKEYDSAKPAGERIEALWAKIDRYADAVAEFNEYLKLDINNDKAGKECLALEAEIRAAIAAAPTPDSKGAAFSPDWANYRQGLKDGAQAAGQAWIRVDERLPEHDTQVVGFWSPRNAIDVHAGCWGLVILDERGIWLNPEDEDDHYCVPTHWMALPPSPASGGTTA